MPSRKGSKNKRTLATDRQKDQLRKEGVDPKDYIVSCLADPSNYEEIRYKAASDLMEYYYAKKPRAVTGAFAVKNVEDMNEEELLSFLGMLGV